MRRLTRLTAVLAFLGLATSVSAQEYPCDDGCAAGEIGEGCTSSSTSTTRYFVHVISAGPPVIQQTCATTYLTIKIVCPSGTTTTMIPATSCL